MIRMCSYSSVFRIEVNKLVCKNLDERKVEEKTLSARTI